MSRKVFYLPRGGDRYPEPYVLDAKRLLSLCGPPWTLEVTCLGAVQNSWVEGWHRLYGISDAPAAPFAIRLGEEESAKMTILPLLAFLGEWRESFCGSRTEVTFPFDAEIHFATVADKEFFKSEWFPEEV